jgi:hypothetical protein
MTSKRMSKTTLLNDVRQKLLGDFLRNGYLDGRGCRLLLCWTLPGNKRVNYGVRIGDCDDLELMLHAHYGHPRGTFSSRALKALLCALTETVGDEF